MTDLPPRPPTPDVRFDRCSYCDGQIVGSRLDMPHLDSKRYEYHCNVCGRTYLQDDDPTQFGDTGLHERFPDGPDCTEHDYRLYFLTAQMAVPAGKRHYQHSHDHYGCLKCGRIFKVNRQHEIIAEVDPRQANFQWMQLWRTARR